MYICHDENWEFGLSVIQILKTWITDNPNFIHVYAESSLGNFGFDFHFFKPFDRIRLYWYLNIAVY